MALGAVVYSLFGELGVIVHVTGESFTVAWVHGVGPIGVQTVPFDFAAFVTRVN